MWTVRRSPPLTCENNCARSVEKSFLASDGWHGGSVACLARRPVTSSFVPPSRRTRSDGVEIVRSDRRQRTVSAYRQGGRLIVLLPARMSRADEDRWVREMLGRLERQEARRRPGDSELAERALFLSARYLDGRVTPARVTWSGRQHSRWGSCTPADGTIRLSTRLQGMPNWVVDYVLLHELAHLLRPGHDAPFWALVERYPRTERARGFLEGVAMAVQLDPAQAGAS